MNGFQGDIAVFGGGIAGLAVSAEAARRGYRVALFEARTLHSMTSASSLRIMHGGLRYLQKLDLLRSLRSLRAQAELLQRFPTVVRPLPCYVPLERYGKRNAFPMFLAGVVYRCLGALGGELPGAVGLLSQTAVAREAPEFAAWCPRGALRWHDALLQDPEALTRLLLPSPPDSPIAVHEQCRITKVERCGEGFRLLDKDGGCHRAAVVVNAAGAQIAQVDLGEGVVGSTGDVRWALGANLILKRRIFGSYACALRGAGGRLYFAVPREVEGRASTVVGTEYWPLDDPALRPEISRERVIEWLDRLNRANPELRLSEELVERVEVGALPRAPQSKDPSGLLGSERIFDNAGYIEVLSTKYTTFLAQARAVLKIATKYV